MDGFNYSLQVKTPRQSMEEKPKVEKPKALPKEAVEVKIEKK
jgi:hypothetical protein